VAARRRDRHQRSHPQCPRAHHRRRLVSTGATHYLLASHAAPPGTRDLWITEINYNPAGSDDFEFVELWNASTNLLDLSGVSLSNAVHFVFPNGFGLDPGAFVLVVEDAGIVRRTLSRPRFALYHPDLNVAGQWIGALDNDGESLSLVGANGLELSTVSFRPSGDWPAAPTARAVRWN
jgi:hypothetical protein